MSEEVIKLTEEGYNNYEQKLRKLKKVDRAAVAERIRQAKEFGDISENAEYETAKSDQAFIEGEIARLEQLLSKAQVIDRSELSTDVVSLGATVTVQNTKTKEKFDITLVSTSEANVERGLISTSSPLGKAIINHEKGDTTQVKTASGMVKYKILDIRLV